VSQKDAEPSHFREGRLLVDEPMNCPKSPHFAFLGGYRLVIPIDAYVSAKGIPIEGSGDHSRYFHPMVIRRGSSWN
jgi:hypothetical protein